MEPGLIRHLKERSRMPPALEPSRADPKGKMVPWTVFLLLSELVMVNIPAVLGIWAGSHLEGSPPCSHHLFPHSTFL